MGFFEGFYSTFFYAPLPFKLFSGFIILAIVSIFLFIIISSLTTFIKNNNSPVVTNRATVVTKRSRTSGGSGDSSATTRYYVTFQFDNGERVELPVRGTEYGMLAEDDVGVLTYQGTRYKGFQRG